MTQQATQDTVSMLIKNIPRQLKEKAESTARTKGFNSLTEYMRNEIRKLAEV